MLRVPRGSWLGLAYACIATAYLSDNSFLWQQRAGSLLLNGDVIRHDPFSWMSSDQLWVNHGWLANAITAKLEQFGGLSMVRIYAMFLAYIFGLAVWKLIRDRTEGIPAVLLAVAVSYPVWKYWSVRPIFAAYIGIVLLLVVLESTMSPKKQCAFLVIIMYLIGSFSPAWTLASVCVLIVLIPRFWGGDNSPVPLLGSLGLSIGLLIVNPWGIDLLKVPIQALSQGKELAILAEWRVPKLRNVLGRYIYVWTVFATLLLIYRRRNVRLYEVLLFLFGAYLGLSAYRGIEIGSLLCLPLMARCTQASRIKMHGSVASRFFNMRYVYALLVPVLVIAALTTPLLGPSYPSTLLNCITEFGEEKADVRVISDDAISGFVVYASWPYAKSFADDRTGHFPLQAYADLDSLELGVDVSKIFKRWNPNMAIIETSSKWADEMHSFSNWEVLGRENGQELWAEKRLLEGKKKFCFRNKKME